MKLIMESWRKFLKEDEVGEHLTVYRIGSSVGELSNRNAANLKGIIAFMDTECEDLKPAYCFPKGITITEYEIELTAPTVDYKCLRGGTSRKPFSSNFDKNPSQCPAEAGVGVREGSNWGDLSYSFLEEGEGWKLVSVGKSIPIADVPSDLGQLGWEEQVEILQGLFSGGELNEEETNRRGEPKKTIVRIEEEEFVEDNGTVVRKLNMYDDTGELVGQPTFSYLWDDPRRLKDSPKPRPGWLERFLEILDWDLALESALPPSLEGKQ